MALIKKSGLGKTTGLGSQGEHQPRPGGVGSPDATRRPVGDAAPDATRVPEGNAAPDATRTPGANGTRRNLTQLPTLPAGTVLQGRYAIEGVLGIGGMSVVYRGRDLRFKDVVRLCAVKEMYQSSPDSQTRLLNLKNFEREAGLLATLNHPAIPKVYDFFEEGGRIYLILELIDGCDLETELDKADGPIDEERAAQWAIQICDVLEYLHGLQPEPIIFRDLKPSNIMLTSSNRIVLIDFGIARIFTRNDRKGTMIGTEGYSPPEQYRGIADPCGDIYALGATLHHLLTKTDPRLETPFTFQERPIRQLNPAVSAEMEAIVMRALEYEMAARWSSAEEMRSVLASLPSLGSAASAARPGSARPAISKSKEATTELIWSFKAEDEIRASPYLHNGMVFIGSYDTNLYALDARNGEFIWKRPTEGGISSSPMVWGEIVIIGSEDHSVYAFDVRRGTPRWSFRTGRPVRSSPRVEDRIIYIGSDDQHIYAIDGLNGRQLWKYRTWMPVRSSAAVGNGIVVIGSNDGHIYCLDAFQGQLRWKQRTQQSVISSPTLAEGMIFVGSMDQNIYALDVEGGWPVWRYRTGHYVNATPAIVGSRVFVGGIDGVFYALEARTGKLVWRYEVGAQMTSSPRVDNGRIYFGAIDGNVYALDAATGELIWRFTCDAPIVSSPTSSAGIVYIGSLDHQLYALRA